jgi:hypothetical protein
VIELRCRVTVVEQVLRPSEAGAAAAVGFTLVSVRGGGGGEVVDGLAQAVEALLGDSAFEDTWAYIDPKVRNSTTERRHSRAPSH